MERIDTVIVGGGQAGLATSYYLTQQGREHIVLEQAARAAPVWRNERWDSFTLVTPNWTLKMPGAEYDGADRDGFMPRDEVVAYFERYVDRFALPVHYNARVLSIEADGRRRVSGRHSRAHLRGVKRGDRDGVRAAPPDPRIRGRLAGDRHPDPQQPVPQSRNRCRRARCSSSAARSLAPRLPRSSINSGRDVFLSVGGAGRAPRRYRGKDVVDWLSRIGFFDITPDKLPVPKEHFAPPHVSGTNGGHTLNLHQFARDGVTLLGHLRGASGDTISLAPDLHETLARVDQFEREVQKMIDGYMQANGLDAPEEELPELRDGYEQPIIEELDLKEAGITHRHLGDGLHL